MWSGNSKHDSMCFSCGRRRGRGESGRQKAASERDLRG